MLMEALAQTRARRQELELERVRRDADLIRARCTTFAGFFREAWHVLEPTTKLRWNWHLQAMCDHLEAVTFGRLHPYGVINVPPGSSKSTIVSVMWQAYEWGPCGMPGNRFLSSSYEIGIVARDARKTRDLIMSEWYQTLWPLELTRTAELSFENTSRGTREGVPFKSLTGKRGDRVTIDDPHSLDQSESEVERDKAVRLYMEGGQNRVNDAETSAIIIVMQRLHEGDLTGAILSRDMGYWHLMLPMEFEPERRCETPLPFRDPRTYDGELLDPVRFPRSWVDKYKNDNDYAHASQNQQSPVPREGGMFKVDKIQLVSHVPGRGMKVRGWDIAGSTRKKSPFTVGGQLEYFDGFVYITDIARERAEIDAAERLIVETAHRDGRQIPQSIPQDPGSSGKSQKRHIANRLAGLDFIFTPETGDKVTRAIPFASMVNAGMVRMVKGPWNDPLINELRNFPGSLFKDQVDALSRAFAELAKYMRDDTDDIGAPIYPDDEDELMRA